MKKYNQTQWRSVTKRLMIHLAQLIDQVNKSVKLKNPADKYTIWPPEEYMGEHTEIGCDEYSNVLNTERNYYATKSITTESEFADKSNIRQLWRTPNDLQSIFKPYTLKINDRNGLGTDESSVFQSLENPIDNIKEIEIIGKFYFFKWFREYKDKEKKQ